MNHLRDLSILRVGISNVRTANGFSPQEIITMNWLAENVIGRIPEAEELTDDAQRLLQLQGVHVDEEQHTEE